MLCLSPPPQRFVIEVKTKGGSKYFIYRRYREFFSLHQNLESKYSPENAEKPGSNSCPLPPLPGETLVSPFTGLECVSVRGSAAAFITIGSFFQHVEVKPKKQSVVSEQCTPALSPRQQVNN